ncbi:hypothetical protein CK203_046152 [Vitis vinifera]|uniref:Uncharacterized protein n=1 Tax=Vitis vinifera TaxID=29760 RepID=A0A438I4C9_VITVI|nr:hypothetical protein CK203_046152 [Vitis vinifera]
MQGKSTGERKNRVKKIEDSSCSLLSHFWSTFRSPFSTCYIPFQSSGSQESNTSNSAQFGVEMKELQPLQADHSKLKKEFCKVINFVDYSLNQGAPAGHESAETPIGHESNGTVARDESNGAVAGDRTYNQMVPLPLPLLGTNQMAPLPGRIKWRRCRGWCHFTVISPFQSTCDLHHNCACHIEYEIAEEAMNFMSYVAEVSRGWDEPNARDMGRMTSQPNSKGEMYI